MLRPVLRATWLMGSFLGPQLPFGPLEAAPTTSDFFTNGAVHRLSIRIAPPDLATLRQNSRKYVPAVLHEGTNIYEKIGLHLKGSTGSFRSVDDKPSMTLNFAKFSRGQKFYGVEKIHLNNSVEDPSFLSAVLGAELFRSANLPAPRVTHALVTLNDRQLGLYVLEEGLTQDFLGRYFRKPTGNLYQPGPGHDINETLDRISGLGPEGEEDLRGLAAAAQEPDRQQRWERLQQRVDVGKFISFVAMEILAGHRDGYCLARNNFLVYHDVDTDKFLFFPHGMDQLFGVSPPKIEPQMSGLLAQAFLGTPQGRQLYRERCAILLTNAFDVRLLSDTVDRSVPSLASVLSKQEARALQEAATALKERMASRHQKLKEQVRQWANN